MNDDTTGPILAIHGGAGRPRRSVVTPELEAIGRDALASALRTGYAMLADGGTAVAAVEAAVCVLEDCPLFNAGYGSALRADGSVVMDAAIMDGTANTAGAVAAVRTVRHPVRAARAVLEHSPHVLLVGEGADRFAADHGLELVPPESFISPTARALWEMARSAPPHGSSGTVGAVARDAKGHLAAATSTGGLMDALPSRVGDTPLIGAGTWADDATCAVSATGVGEYLIRAAFAHEVDTGMRLGGWDLAVACEQALARVTALGGSGGCVAVDAAGHIAMPFSTPAMPRGCIGADGTPRIAMYSDAPVQPL